MSQFHQRIAQVYALCVLVVACDAAEPTLLIPSASSRAVADASPITGDADAGLVHRDASLPPPSPDELAAWRDAESFSVQLEDTGCFGTCPSFWSRIDQAGHVAYLGASWVARPGFFELDVPAADAKALYLAMLDAGFLRLRERYNVEADGCTVIYTDMPTYTFTLRTGERTKRVEMYAGCRSAVEGFFERFEPEIRRAASLGVFLYPSPPRNRCAAPESFPAPNFEQSWVVSDSSSLNKEDYGILRMAREGKATRWHVTDCEGRELAAGVSIPGQVDERVLMSAADAPSSFAWPGLAAPQGVALLNRTSLPSITVRLLTLREQVTQWARPGDSCEAQP